MTVDVQYTMSRPVRWDDSAHHGGTLWQTRRETLLIYWFHVYTSTTGVKNEQRCIKKHLFGIYICIYMYIYYIYYIGFTCTHPHTGIKNEQRCMKKDFFGMRHHVLRAGGRFQIVALIPST